MTDKAISPLRRRMTEDMTIRKLAPKTQASYIRAVRDFSIFLGCPPAGPGERGEFAALSTASGLQQHLDSQPQAVHSGAWRC